MTQADALQQAMARFGAQIDSLEQSLAQLFEAQGGAANVKEQLRSLIDERNRLQSERDQFAFELDQERMRSRRLEIANEEVSGRLEAMMGTLKTMLPAKGAEA